MFILDYFFKEERLGLYAYVCETTESLWKHQETGYYDCFGELDG